ncbi:DUF4129 domain-containing protein [Lacinutrix sp. MedPE-SW]|uniref:DUF4129 domain-containing protein n=1 Tax=Lacinutrix sp. MedPE-SW TaxID=1860087 RepID=UPI00091B31F6|nr:DUF4129 domain-containing protein [Lacinutrix sp. MedPE-SW]OIQ22991.1 MAG: DUF4129 domain-containing protein [Lacinutrix sp. MedPE-SW]
MPNLSRFFLFLFVCFLSLGQQDAMALQDNDSYYKKQDITKEDLEKYTQDKAFNYKETIEDPDNWWTRFKRWVRNGLMKFFEWLFGGSKAEGIVWFIFRVLPYILLGILIFLLIRFFLKVNSRNLIYGEQNKATINFTDEEQIIKNEDINALITEAIKQNDYRLAIRYYYLLTLKNLSETNIIDWQLQKTNADYINEIKTNTIQAQFEKITKIYDYVWYGEFKVDALKFESLKQKFINLNNQVK